MARFVAGDVIVVPFPHTNQAGVKKRAALVLCATKADDLLVCMITSAAYGNSESILLDTKAMKSGGLRVQSSLRPERLLVISPDLVEKKIGRISPQLVADVKSAIISWLEAN